MPTPLILFLNGLTDPYLAQVRAAAPGWRVESSEDPAVYGPLLPDAVVVVDWRRRAEAVCLAPGSALRWVHNWGAGVESLPLSAFRERGIVVTNTSGIHADPISETVFALILSFARGLHRFLRHQAEHEWQNESDLAVIHGKTLGLLGVGAIGTETARLARAFGMTVLGFRRSGEPSPGVDRLYGQHDLTELLMQCDYVVNSLPLTPDTRHLLGRAQFRAMKPTSFYVNVGRGATHDTDALVEALREGWIAGAGIDAHEKEPLPADHPLWDLPDVFILPHNSGVHPDYDQRALDILLANLPGFLAGGSPSYNRVDLEAGY